MKVKTASPPIRSVSTIDFPIRVWSSFRLGFGMRCRRHYKQIAMLVTGKQKGRPVKAALLLYR